MFVQGFIKKIGMPREWATGNGEKRLSYPCIISIPYVNDRGEAKNDEILAEHTIGNDAYMESLQRAVQEGRRMEFQLGFAVKEWQGREFMNARLYNIQIML
ncbi:MAG: hypothetical protein II278_09550 [Bacteroidaceae bacterium]|jgi:hypothetical protein|nr:hypothetical protein [Bacteroidaceae bacterium]